MTKLLHLHTLLVATAYDMLFLEPTQHKSSFDWKQSFCFRNVTWSKQATCIWPPRVYQKECFLYVSTFLCWSFTNTNKTPHIFATEKNVLLFFFKTSVLWYSLNHTQQSHTVTKTADTWVFLSPFGIAAHFRASFSFISKSRCTCLFTFYLILIVWEQGNHW